MARDDKVYKLFLSHCQHGAAVDLLGKESELETARQRRGRFLGLARLRRRPFAGDGAAKPLLGEAAGVLIAFLG